MEPRSRWKSILRRLFGPALLALMVTTVVAVGVSAHDGSGGPGGGGPGGGDGGRGGTTISAISGTQLTLVTADGWTRTLDAAGATVMSGTSTITVGDLKVGDEIAIRQSRNFDGSVQVVEIDLVPPHVDGTVTAVNTGSLTIQTAAGATMTVTVTATTTYSADRASATLADVTVGSVARVQGTANADGTFTATSVSVHPARLGGTVTATTADSITVADASGATATIHVTATTTYRTATGSGTLANVTVGSIVRAEGVRNADGSLTATAVRIGTANGGFGGNRGGGHRGFGGPDWASPASPSANPSASPSASPSA
jgi:hypothetical protein